MKLSEFIEALTAIMNREGNVLVSIQDDYSLRNPNPYDTENVVDIRGEGEERVLVL